jgi:hypothetical protein
MLPLTSPPRAKVIHWLDVTSYLFIAVGFGLIAMVLTLGRLYWWLEAPWLGVMLAGGIIAVMCAAVIELNRASPLLDIRWLASREVLHFTAVLLVFRIVLSEQTSGAFGFFQVLGLQNDQMATLCWIILAASVAGGLACAAVMKPGRAAGGGRVHGQPGDEPDPPGRDVSEPGADRGGRGPVPAAGSRLRRDVGAEEGSQLHPELRHRLPDHAKPWRPARVGSGRYLHHVAREVPLPRPGRARHALQSLRGPACQPALGSYGRVLTDKSLLNAEGLALLGQQATKEANILAYNDAFLAIAVLALFALAALTVHVGVAAIGRRLAPAPQPAAP